MTEQKEVYLIIYDHPGSDCCLPHAFYFDSLEESQIALGDFAGGTVTLIKGITVERREVGLYPEVV